MTGLAAVDCGTNSIRLLVAESPGPGEGVRELHREMRIVRLGEGVDETGRLDPAALDRTRAALAEYAGIIRAEGVSRVRMVATSATRDAANRGDFTAMVEDTLGVSPEVISGEEEAALSFRGAVQDVPVDEAALCVIDLGGGSTEFVLGDAAGPVASHSARMGCVRLTERILHSDPATPEEEKAARREIRERLAETLEAVPLADAGGFIGCAGTFTTLSALAQGLESYDPAAIHGSELRFDALRVMTRQIRGEAAATRALNPVIHAGRADVIGSGAVIVEEIMDLVERIGPARSFIISEKDILDGIIAGLDEVG